MLLTAALVAPACSLGGGGAPATSVAGDEPPAPVRPPLELGDAELTSVLVGDGLSFGDPSPEAQQVAQAYGDDPLVRAAVVREVFRTEDGAPLGQVTVVALEPESFSDEEAVEAYVVGLATIDPEAGADPLPPTAGGLSLGDRDALVATADGRSVVAFREQNLVVLVEADEPADAGGVARRMAAAIDAGQEGTGATETPLVLVDKNAAFVDVGGFRFAPFLADDDESGFESLDAPVIDGLADIPEARLVVVGNEIRGAAWSLPVSPDTYASEGALVDPMRQLAAERAGVDVDDVTTEVVARTTIFSADGEEAVRVFNERSLVLVVDGLEGDSDGADAVATAWARALADL